MKKNKDNVSTVSVIRSDLADRGTLANYFFLKNPDLMDIIFQLCFSLMQMKKMACLIHRDIKPNNVLIYRNKGESMHIRCNGNSYKVAKKYRVVITDYGTSSTTIYSRRIYYKMDCWRIGTLNWYPPVISLYYNIDEENETNGILIRSFQSDIWAIGMITLSIVMCSFTKKNEVVSFISMIENNEDIWLCTTLIEKRIKGKKVLTKNQILLSICCCVIQKSLGNGFLPSFSHEFGTCYKLLSKMEILLKKSVSEVTEKINTVKKIYGTHVIDFIKTCLQWNQKKTLKYRDILNDRYFNHLREI